MSNEQPMKIEPGSSAPMTDVMILWAEEPVAIIPISDQAKELFLRWGWNSSADGILPPPSPIYFADSVPGTWTISMRQMEDGEEVKILEVPLPQPRVVVH